MPSAFKSTNGQWIADFRGLHMTGRRRRRVRIPTGHALKPKAYANECERLCRLLEYPPTVEQRLIEKALTLKAITADQAASLDQFQTAGEQPRFVDYSELTIRAAADAHPSTRREAERQRRDYDKRMKYLDKFMEWAGITLAREITLDAVQRWVTELRRKGYAWDTRRHHLAYIRRAAKIGATHGMPDPLAGFRLDHNDDYKPIQTWPLDSIQDALKHLKDERCRAIIGLGIGMGLRPSEIVRVMSDDIKNGILTVGSRERKNKASIRRLPVPQVVLGWLKPLKKSDCPLIRTQRPGAKKMSVLSAMIFYAPGGKRNWPNRWTTMARD